MMKRKAKGLICIAILGSMLAGCGNKEVSTTASDMKSGDVELTYCVNSSNASAGVTHDPEAFSGGPVKRYLCWMMIRKK